MPGDQLSTLIRAVARLRIGGVVDADLIDALAALILTRPTTTAANRDQRAKIDLAPRAQPVSSGGSSRRQAAPVVRPQHDRARRPDTSRALRKKDARLTGKPSTLQKIEERADLQTPRHATGEASFAAERQRPEPPGPAAPLESLFAPGRVRAILRELVTLKSASGPLDMDAAIAAIARRTEIRHLPRRVVSTLGHTVQLLFDAGPAMLPFTRDKQQLATTTIRVFGRDRVRVADFISSPLQRVRTQRQVRWDEIRWPTRGSTVVVVSDLGIGSDPQGQAHEWRRFVEESDKRGLRSVVLIPYARERWPETARAFGTALTWDLDTGVQTLHKRGRWRPLVR
jgi:hypothetical protein